MTCSRENRTCPSSASLLCSTGLLENPPICCRNMRMKRFCCSLFLIYFMMASSSLTQDQPLANEVTAPGFNPRLPAGCVTRDRHLGWQTHRQRGMSLASCRSALEQMKLLEQHHWENFEGFRARDSQVYWEIETPRVFGDNTFLLRSHLRLLTGPCSGRRIRKKTMCARYRVFRRRAADQSPSDVHGASVEDQFNVHEL